MGKTCYLRTSWCIVTTRYLATTWWLGAAKCLCCAWYRAQRHQQVNPDFWLGFHFKRLWGLWSTRVYGVGTAQTGFHQVQQGAAESTQSWKPQEAHPDLFQQWWGWGWHHGRKDWSLDNRPFVKEADCGLWSLWRTKIANTSMREQRSTNWWSRRMNVKSWHDVLTWAAIVRTSRRLTFSKD